MKRNNLVCPLAAVILFLRLTALAQKTPVISLKKDHGIYFFQKGPKSDTLVKQQNDLFYLLVPDSLKQHISIVVENGRLTPTTNDSLVRVELLKGLSYESLYLVPENSAGKMPRRLQSLINGTAATENNNLLRLKIRNVKEEKLLLENVFYYKD